MHFCVVHHLPSRFSFVLLSIVFILLFSPLAGPRNSTCVVKLAIIFLACKMCYLLFLVLYSLFYAPNVSQGFSEEAYHNKLIKILFHCSSIYMYIYKNLSFDISVAQCSIHLHVEHDLLKIELITKQACRDETGL